MSIASITSAPGGSGRRRGFERYPRSTSFIQADFPESSLFKIPETDKGEVLCLEGFLDPAEEFKAVVEASGWTGLVFDLLWESG